MELLATPLEIVQQEKLLYGEFGTEEESKMRTLQHVKVRHDIEQYLKRVPHEEKCNMKRLRHKNVQHGNGAV